MKILGLFSALLGIFVLIACLPGVQGQFQEQCNAVQRIFKRCIEFSSKPAEILSVLHNDARDISGQPDQYTSAI